MKPNKWITWTGGDCPVPFGTPIEVKYRCREDIVTTAGSDSAHCWGRIHHESGGDIVAYRLIGDVPDELDQPIPCNLEITLNYLNSNGERVYIQSKIGDHHLADILTILNIGA